MAYLIDQILPVRRVNLLGGPSNAGKTRWVIPALKEWEQGNPVLGRASHPAPWAYVVGDRLLEEAEDTIRDMGYNPNTITIVPAFGRDNKGFLQIMMAVGALKPVPELLVIEGFGDLAPDPQRKRQVRDFMSEAGAYCQCAPGFPNGLCILGIMESPKMKPQERYADARQRISGVAGWGYHASTVLMLEPDDLDDDNSPRTLSASVKYGLNFKLEALGQFDGQNRLIFP